MLHSDYPLQALLYTVVLHRFLRWRVPNYDPAQHLGGVLYLFVRGMCGRRHPGDRRAAVRRVQLAAARRAGGRTLGSARRGKAGSVTVTDVELAVGASGLLQTFNEAGVLDVSDVRVADRICVLGKESDEQVALAVALLVRGLRGGSVCIELETIASDIGVDDVPWPEPAGWLEAVRDSALLGQVLHLYDERLLYLDRYWREEKQVCDDLLALQVSKPTGDVPASERLFPAGFDEQREAAEIALAQAITVLTGGPGTGKTTTVARLLALLAEQAELAGAPRPRIALAAPTGKAAARLQEAVQLEVAELDAADRARLGELAGDDTASAAGQPAGHVVAVSARSRKPVAARRDCRRRDFDGVADNDGAAAGGGAPGRPADPGRRRRPARVGGSRRRAGRFGRRHFGAHRYAGSDAEDVAPVRQVNRPSCRGDPSR